MIVLAVTEFRPLCKYNVNFSIMRWLTHCQLIPRDVQNPIGVYRIVGEKRSTGKIIQHPTGYTSVLRKGIIQTNTPVYPQKITRGTLSILSSAYHFLPATSDSPPSTFSPPHPTPPSPAEARAPFAAYQRAALLRLRGSWSACPQ